MNRWIEVGGAMLITFCGCSVMSAGAADSEAPRFTEAPQVSANPNRAVPLAAVLRFSVGEPVRTAISVSDGKHEWQLDYDEVNDPRKGLAVVGMRPNRKHVISVTIRDAAGNTRRAPQTLEFTTPDLPTDPTDFPPVQVRASRPERMEPGISILSVRRVQPYARRDNAEFSRKYGLLLGLDVEGEVVWYYRSDSRISDFTVRRSGNIVYLTEDFRAIEIDLLGNTVAKWYASRRPQGPADAVPVDTLTFHHAVEEMPSGNLLVMGGDLREIDNYYSSNDLDSRDKRQKVMGDDIVEFDRTGKIVWRWNTFDHLDPFLIGYAVINNYWVVRGFPDTLDWTHGNGLFYDERKDSVLANFRQLSAVVNIDHKSGKIRWILSEPTGWPKEQQTLLLRGRNNDDYPWYQHAPSLTPVGTVMVYNNANQVGRLARPVPANPNRFSRACEFAIDTTRGTVHHVWSSEEFGPESVTTGAMGDADWLPETGNVLVCYGASRLRGRGPFGQPWPRIREVTHTTPPQVLFEVVLAADEGRQGPNWQLFGAKRVKLFASKATK